LSDSPEGEAQQYKPITRWFVVFMVRTRKGLSLLDRLGNWKASRPLGWLMLALMPVAAAVALYVVAFLVSALYFSPESQQLVSNVRTISPLANFLLPGINPYLPLSVWLAIVVAVFIHEASHGIVARNVGMKVKAAGVVLLAFLPIGAFVEVDDKELKQSRSRDSLRVLAAGSGINFVVGIACILLLILTVSTMTPAVKGAAIVGVVQDSPSLHSPAWVAGIRPGDFVTAINNSPVNDLGVLRGGNYAIGEEVNVTVWHDGQTRVLPIVLGNYTVITQNTTSGQSTSVSYPFLGVDQLTYSSLQGVANGYTTLYKSAPLAYISYIPTFQRVELYIPFSDALSGFYTSPLGALTPAVTNALFWLFFVNFNLAIFNSLPIYLMDGGQAFEIFLRGAGKGKISDELARRLTTGTTLALVFALFILIAGPYITGAFAPT
jgi:membrane-associated protease RseP (regulator of RpoE activity)